MWVFGNWRTELRPAAGDHEEPDLGLESELSNMSVSARSSGTAEITMRSALVENKNSSIKRVRFGRPESDDLIPPVDDVDSDDTYQVKKHWDKKPPASLDTEPLLPTRSVNANALTPRIEESTKPAVQDELDPFAEVPTDILYVNTESVLQRFETLDELSRYVARAALYNCHTGSEVKKKCAHLLNTPLSNVNACIAMGTYFEHLYKNDILTDIEFELEKESFSAHRIVICCFSDRFADEFCKHPSTIDSIQTKFSISGISSQAFAAFLQFCYTGHVSTDIALATELEAMADYFRVPTLRDKFREIMSGRPLEQAVKTLMYDVDNSDVQYMKAYVCILNNFTKALKLSDFFNIGVDLFILILKSDDLVVNSEYDVFDAALQWLQHDPSERGDYTNNIMSRVRFQHMNPDEMYRCVEAIENLPNAQEEVKEMVMAANWELTCNSRSIKDSQCSEPKRRRITPAKTKPCTITMSPIDVIQVYQVGDRGTALTAQPHQTPHEQTPQPQSLQPSPSKQTTQSQQTTQTRQVTQAQQTSPLQTQQPTNSQLYQQQPQESVYMQVHQTTQTRQATPPRQRMETPQPVHQPTTLYKVPEPIQAPYVDPIVKRSVPFDCPNTEQQPLTFGEASYDSELSYSLASTMQDTEHTTLYKVPEPIQAPYVDPIVKHNAPFAFPTTEQQPLTFGERSYDGCKLSYSIASTNDTDYTYIHRSTESYVDRQAVSQAIPASPRHQQLTPELTTEHTPISYSESPYEMEKEVDQEQFMNHRRPTAFTPVVRRNATIPNGIDRTPFIQRSCSPYSGKSGSECQQQIMHDERLYTHVRKPNTERQTASEIMTDLTQQPIAHQGRPTQVKQHPVRRLVRQKQASHNVPPTTNSTSCSVVQNRQNNKPVKKRFNSVQGISMDKTEPKAEIFVVGRFHHKQHGSAAGDVPSMTSDQCINARVEDGSWMKACKLPEARQHNAMAIMGGYLYVFGGSDPTKIERHTRPSHTTYRMHLQNKQWSHVNDMKAARYRHCACTADNKIYAVGGLGIGRSILRTIECFDGERQEWNILTLMHTPRYGAMTSVIQGRLFVVGGIGESPHTPASLHVLKNVVCYNIKKHSWSSYRYTDLPFPRCLGSMVTVNNRLFLCGGARRTKNSESCALSSVGAICEYDTVNDEWIHVGDMKVPRYDMGVTVAGQMIYMIGGVSSPAADDNLKSVECYDTGSGSWMTGIKDMPFPGKWISCATVI